MKIHLLLITLFVASISFDTLAQCTPNTTYTKSGFYPEEFPNQCVNKEIDEQVDLAFPSDTLIFGITVPFDSFEIVSMPGLPSGVTYNCHNTDCRVIAIPNELTYGCISISGQSSVTVDSGDITIVAKLYYTNTLTGQKAEQGLTQAVNIKVLSEEECNNVGLEDQLDESFNLSLFPNPASDQLSLNIDMNSTGLAKLSIYDLTGSLVKTVRGIKLSPGTNQLEVLNAAQLESGTYMSRLEVHTESRDYNTGRVLIIE